MEDNKNPKGAARSAASLGRRRRRRLVVTHLVRISDVFAPFSEPVLAPGIICSPAGRGKFYNPGLGLCFIKKKIDADKVCLVGGRACRTLSVCLVGALSEALSVALSDCLVAEGMSAEKTLVGPCWKGLVGGLVADKVFVGRLF